MAVSWPRNRLELLHHTSVGGGGGGGGGARRSGGGVLVDNRKYVFSNIKTIQIDTSGLSFGVMNHDGDHTQVTMAYTAQ